MNKIHSVLLIILVSTSTFAQTEYDIDDFSKTYFVKILLDKNNKNKIIKKGTIEIWTKKNKKKLFSVQNDELVFDQTNIKNDSMHYSYKKQNIIIYEDFNFDGQKDFAIWDAKDACYGGKSYKIFLKIKTGFALNPTFSNLTDAPFCGMFKMDHKNRQIETFSKSGCCKQTTTYYRLNADTIMQPIKKIIIKFNPEDSIIKKRTFYFKKGKL